MQRSTACYKSRSERGGGLGVLLHTGVPPSPILLQNILGKTIFSQFFSPEAHPCGHAGRLSCYKLELVKRHECITVIAHSADNHIAERLGLYISSSCFCFRLLAWVEMGRLINLHPENCSNVNTSKQSIRRA